MYDELVSRLRSSCESCKLWDGHNCCLKGDCTAQTRLQAADAIEELSEDNTALNGTVTNLLEQIKELSKPRWIPVTERLPKYGERVLVFGGATMYVAYYDKNRYGGERWHKLNSKSHYCNPTHWMPLPKSPKEETE